MSTGPYDPCEEFVDDRDDDDTDLSDYDAGIDESPDVNDDGEIVSPSSDGEVRDFATEDDRDEKDDDEDTTETRKTTLDQEGLDGENIFAGSSDENTGRTNPYDPTEEFSEVDVDELAHDTPPTWEVDATPEDDERGWSYWWKCETGDAVHASKMFREDSYYVEIHGDIVDGEYEKIAEELPTRRDAIEVAIGTMGANKCVLPEDRRARARDRGVSHSELQAQDRADRRAELMSRKMETDNSFEDRNRLPDSYDPTEDVRDDEESADSEDDNSQDVEESEESKNPIEVEFGAKDVADDLRDEHEEFLCSLDDRRLKTVRFVQDTPDEVLEDARAAATETRADKTKDSYGQTELTEREKGEIDFSENSVFHARTAKAIAVGEGVSNWLDYYDPTLTTDEHIEVYKNAEAASRLDSDELDDETVDEKLAEMEKTAESEECDHAERGCKDGYEEACEFLVEECGVNEDRVDNLLDEDDFEDVDADGLDTEIDAEDPPLEVRIALDRAWTGYRAGRADAKDGDVDGAREAREYAGIINAVRQELGQDLLEFEPAGEFDGGVVDPDDVGADFDASGLTPYDPTEDIAI